MKKIYVPVIVLLMLSLMSGLLVSCKKNSFLEATNTTNLTQTVVFTDSAYSVGFLANIYSNIEFAPAPSRFAFTTLGGATIVCGGLDAASDESEVSHTYSTTALDFAIGSIDQNNVTDDAYRICYSEIRAVNQLKKNIGTAPLQSVLKTQMKAEGQFLRAYYYFILLEHYGGVPIVGDAIYDYTKPVPAVRATFAKTVSYIAAQLDSAALTLPYNQQGQNLGRASGGACQALKARLYLYAASPLYDPSSGQVASTPSGVYGAKNPELTRYVNATADSITHRWQLARDAARSVISSQQFALYTDSISITGYGEEGAFQRVFTQRGNNSEYIFEYMQPLTGGGYLANYLEGLFNPPTRTGANGAFPYQSTVDAFPMHNGKAITDPTSGYDPKNPYANRDPRLRYSIVYNGSLLPIRESNGTIPGYSPIFIGLDVVNGTAQPSGTDAVHQGTLTGYYNNKMVDPQAVANAGLPSGTNRLMPIMRYAEVLLNYAEAVNEVSGAIDTTYQVLEAIRKRAGISPGTTVDQDGNFTYGLAAGMSQSQMRTAIQNERRIELAYEGHRFFDVRRWLIASDAENQPEYGMEVDTIKSGTTVTGINYNQFLVRKHIFTPRMYLWPFPQTEIGKGQGLVQNPGY